MRAQPGTLLTKLSLELDEDRQSEGDDHFTYLLR
jgi:hypothetical protein